MHLFEINPDLDNKIIKLSKRDKSTYIAVKKKMDEILNSHDMSHYKHLRYDMRDFQRVHIGHFVLLFRFDKSHDMIVFEDFDHHDKIYEQNH